ncbi:helix-turn-helix transcriptional regulator [Nocardia brasiliensis]|uniref:helix-turn-helix transcriptional regulator n=1 Tax=Nocardia brasiliensis TaxID=37326 RepID=UPI002455018D|nr:AAA family ATPase [Nocardia brasiliensis]
MLELAGAAPTKRTRPMTWMEPQTASTGFIGRNPELAQIADLLGGSTRLVTLIGSGGVGKTRLAAEAIAAFQRSDRVVVYWVRLACLPRGADATAVAAEISRAVVGDHSRWPTAVETLDSGQGGRRILLVLDCCEHVIDGAGRVVAELLDIVPGLTIVATSREPIGWVDEHLLSVPPLTQQQAVDLFRERAELAGCSVSDPAQIAMAEQICIRVHNHPLFVRLAAARLLRQPLAVVLRELSGTEDDRRMQWTHGPRVGAEARHRRVRDVIGWSYDLCEPKERLLLERMSVFTVGLDTNPAENCGGGSGADLDAIRAICADEEDHDREVAVRLADHEIEGLLAHLTDRSLVSRQIAQTTVRYHLVESVRLFAHNRLVEREGGSAESVRLAKRHSRYYRDIVLRARAEWGEPAEQAALDRLRPSWDNIMAALARGAGASGERAVAVQIAAALFPLPLALLGDSVVELRERIEGVLRMSDGTDSRSAASEIAARAMAAWLALCQGRREVAEPLIEDCFAACGLASTDWRRTPEIDAGLPAPAEFVWGTDLLFLHSDARSAVVFARAREKYRQVDDHAGAAASELSQRLAAGLLGDSAELEEREWDQGGQRQTTAVADLVTAGALTRQRESARAMALERQALRHLLSAGDRWGALWAVQSRVWTLVRTIEDASRSGGGNRREVAEMATEAARLLGGATAFRARLGIDISGLGPYADQHHKAVEILTEFLGQHGYAEAVQEGALLSPESDELLRFALGALSLDALPPERSVRQHNPSHWGDLTLAEEQVALLAAAGWTNTAIAARRGSSCKTVNAQMVSIFQKLGITARGEIIRFVPADKIGQVRAEAVVRPRRSARVTGRR